MLYRPLIGLSWPPAEATELVEQRLGVSTNILRLLCGPINWSDHRLIVPGRKVGGATALRRELRSTYGCETVSAERGDYPDEHCTRMCV